ESRGLAGPILSMQTIFQETLAGQMGKSCVTFQALANTLRQADGIHINRIDDADKVGLVQFSERVPDAFLDGLACVTSPPEFPAKSPSNFEIGPAFRLQRADAARQLAAGAFNHSKHSVTAQMPMPDLDS